MVSSSEIRRLFFSVAQLRKEYGDVFTIYLGSQRAVVLCGFKTVKAALVDQADEFGARAELPIVEKTSQGFGERIVIHSCGFTKHSGCAAC